MKPPLLFFLAIIRLYIETVIGEIKIQTKIISLSYLDNDTGKRYFLMSIKLNVYVKLKHHAVE